MSERTGPRRQAKALTPWHDAIRRADIDALDERGQTGLMNAVYWGNLELAAYLVERGADKRLAGSAGPFAVTPLEYAKTRGMKEIVRILEEPL